MKKCNIWETNWGVLTKIINDKVGQGYNKDQDNDCSIDEVKIREIERLTKIDIYLPMIIKNEKTQLLRKENKIRKFLQRSLTSFKGPRKY